MKINLDRVTEVLVEVDNILDRLDGKEATTREDRIEVQKELLNLADLLHLASAQTKMAYWGLRSGDHG